MSTPSGSGEEGKPLPLPSGKGSRSTLVTGSSGFIGSSIVRALVSERWSSVSLLVRRPGEGSSNVTEKLADIRDGHAVDLMMGSVDTVIHAASYIGPDPEMCREVNVTGTTNVVNAWLRHKKTNLIYVSTTAVYGSGPHRNARVGSLKEAPNSAVSRSRRLAERIVLDAGGCVIRPGLVYGVGDTWVFPSLARLTSTLGALVEGGNARTSLIRANDLGYLVSSAARALPQLSPSTIWHAANTQPSTISALIDQYCDPFLREAARRSISREAALQAASGMGLSTRQIDLASRDHWYEAAGLWDISHRQSPTSVILTREELNWYRKEQCSQNERS